jgi:hypothetical protein
MSEGAFWAILGVFRFLNNRDVFFWAFLGFVIGCRGRFPPKHAPGSPPAEFVALG